MTARDGIRIGQSCSADARVAVREFHEAVAQPDAALVIFFCSDEYDLHAVAAEMSARFAGVPCLAARPRARSDRPAAATTASPA